MKIMFANGHERGKCGGSFENLPFCRSGVDPESEA
jgi:hypothetical protein